MRALNKVFEIRTYYMVLQQKLEKADVLNDEIKQASLDLWEKINELEKDRISLDWIKYGMYMRQGNDLKVIELMQRNKEIKKALESDSIHLMDLYEESGIEWVVSWGTNVELKNRHIRYFNAAQNYVWIGNKDAALDYLEKAFESRELLMPLIKYDLDFEVLRTEPRFIALLKKMNLGGY